MKRYEIIITQAWGEVLTLSELAEATGVDPDLIRSFMEYDLLGPTEYSEKGYCFGVEAVSRLRLIQRLRAELGVNLAGVAVVLELLAKVERLQEELDWLRS